MTLGDRICVMNDGRVMQTDRPQALYDQPTNLFVATFMGSPPMNLITEQNLTVGFRPEDVQPVNASRAPHARTVSARVLVVEPLGNEALVHAHTEGFEFTARVAPDAAPKPGDTLDFAIDLSKLHYFDPATGERVAHPA
jgi:multiple sugar transport system ATP-binding protein